MNSTESAMPLPNPQTDEAIAVSQRRIRIAYASALIVTGLLGVFILGALLQSAAGQQHTANAIGLTSSQRMNIQRLTQIASLLVKDIYNREPATLLAETRQRINLLEQKRADYWALYQGVELPPQVNVIYNNLSGGLNARLDEYLQTVRRFEATPSEWTPESATYQWLVDSTPQIREQFNSIITIYEGIQNEQIASLRTLAFFIFGALIAALALEALFIFRPMERAIRRQQSLLAAEIAQRRAAETSLRRSEAAYRLLAHHLPDMAVLMFDNDMRYNIAEGPVLAATGYSREAVEGKTAREVLPAASYEILAPLYEATLKGQPTVMERAFRGRDYVTHLVPIYDELRQIVGGMVVSQDVTARKQAEEALRASEERFRSIAENASDLIVLVNNEFRIVYANRAYQTLLGYDPPALIGQRLLELARPDNAETIEREALEVIRQRQPFYTVEFRHAHADGHYVWVEGRVTFLYAEGGELQGAVAVLRDQTIRHEMLALEFEQERLNTALGKERELNELKSRMMFRITHEFRTPLTVILSLVETLERYHDRLTDEQRASKRKAINSQIRRLTRMLDDIGLVVRGDFVPQHMVMGKVNLNQLCQQVITDIEAELDQPGRFVLEAAPDGVIRGEQVSLRRCLYEILLNGVRFSPVGKPVLVQVEDSETHVTVRVTDEGIGILPEEKPRLFEPFFRGSNIDEIGGLGVGLTIAQAAVRAHHGTIEHKESAGGTQVMVTLPR